MAHWSMYFPRRDFVVDQPLWPRTATTRLRGRHLVATAWGWPPKVSAAAAHREPGVKQDRPRPIVGFWRFLYVDHQSQVEVLIRGCLGLQRGRSTSQINGPSGAVCPDAPAFERAGSWLLAATIYPVLSRSNRWLVDSQEVP